MDYITSKQASKLLRYLKLPKLFKMLKMHRVLQFGNVFKGTLVAYLYKVYSGVVKLAILFAQVALVIHLFACLFAAVGTFDNSEFLDTWIKRFNYQDNEHTVVYLTAYYFGVTVLTTVGFGDIFPFTSVEIFTVIIWMLFALVFYSYAIGLVTGFFNEQETKTSLLKSKLKDLETFSSSLNISPVLYDALVKSLEFSARKLAYQWLPDNKKIYSEIPVRLQYEFLIAIYGEIVYSCPFFAFEDMGYCAKIFPMLKPRFCKSGTILFREGDFASQSNFCRLT